MNTDTYILQMIWGVYETSFILFSIIFLDNVKKNEELEEPTSSRDGCCCQHGHKNII